jgi:hypothetical protein
MAIFIAVDQIAVLGGLASITSSPISAIRSVRLMFQ